MIVVNLYGAPGAGKSTGAAYVFSMLKMSGINAELITEYAKDMAWENNTTAIDNQAYIFGQQYYKTTRCEDKVDVIITDSPILLSALYNHSQVLGEEFNNTVARVAKSYKTLDYMILRDKPYNPVGRFQTEEESDAMSKRIEELLDRYQIKYKKIRGTPNEYTSVVIDVMRELSLEGKNPNVKNKKDAFAL